MVKTGSATDIAVVDYMTYLSCFRDSICREECLGNMTYRYCKLVGSLKDAYLGGAFTDAEFAKETESIASMYLQAVCASRE